MVKALKNGLTRYVIFPIFVLSLLSSVLLTLTSCGKNSPFPTEGGSETEISKKYEAGATKAYLVRHAPYEIRVDETDPDLQAMADFTIGLETVVLQPFTIPEGSTLMEVRFAGISITQPLAGSVELREAALSWPPANPGSAGTVQVNGDTFVIPRESYVNIGTNEYEVRMNFFNDTIGTLTKVFDSLSGTQAEADANFNEFTESNGLDSDKLRFHLRYRLEITVIDADTAAEEVLFRYIDLELFPGSFLSQDHNSQQPYIFDNAGKFNQ